MAYINKEKAVAYVEEQCRLFRDDEAKQSIVEGCVEAVKFVPAADVVSLEAYKQCMWERDTAIEQLKSYGVGFAENADVVKLYCRCEKCHNSEEIGDFLYCNYFNKNVDRDGFCSESC